jgi:deoxyribonuclease V
MRMVRSHPPPGTPAEAAALQEGLRAHLRQETPPPPRTVAGLDVSYATDSDRLAAAVVVLDAATLEVVEEVTATGRAAFEYVPGLLAFREAPALVAALERLATTPDVLVCDGYGLAHPRRFGLACHLGVLTDLPSIGVAKTPFTAAGEEPAGHRGAWADLRDGGEVVGRALRTRAGVRPVFVSVGHRATLDAACDLVLTLTPRYRLPETTRRADRLSRDALARSGD